MITVQCAKRLIQSFFMETKVKDPVYINDEPTYDLYLEKRDHLGYLYINGVRAKALPRGGDYQSIEPTLFKYFDEICQPFDDDTEINVEDESFLPWSIKVKSKPVLEIEYESQTFIMTTDLGIDEIRNISNRIERTFRLKIIPILKEVGLYA